MKKRYVMFVDERGFLNSYDNGNNTLIGIIFEYDYCIDSKSENCVLRTKLSEYKEKIFSHSSFHVPFDDILLDEKVYKSINMVEIKKFIDGLPSLINSLKFTIIASTIKQDTTKSNDSYSIAAKKLLKKFYSFIISNNGEAGGIILEARNNRDSYVMQQNFFNIYNERNVNLSILGDIKEKINTFMVCEKKSKTYGSCIELSNIINDIIYRVSSSCNDVERKYICRMEYDNVNKLLDCIKQKTYRDTELGITSDQLQTIYYNNIETINKELTILREQLMLKDSRINEKEKEINNLNNEIQMLNQQLEEVLVHGKDKNILSRIFSDIDVSIKGVSKIVTAAKN
ncbi:MULTISPECIES: hypothetical protein [unclassified Clostridium]|uniref:hypothetical protein n=1 Tax=unclassified Clostridium TaxID=2614128 RepID=UPI000297F7F9|nr:MULTISPECIES: hypothetical protein [unclassified Clostridium]EKQ53291.1 MAG: hypothetical protein A370_03808 [Clostridium sp. Maddingley MBC34-26]